MATSDDINALIAAKETALEARRRELEVEEAVLKGMKIARDSMRRRGTLPSAAAVNGSMPLSSLAEVVEASFNQPSLQRRSGGRQPGSISRQWRYILSDAFHDFGHGSPFSEFQIIPIGRKRGLNLRPRDVHERMIAHAASKLVEAIDSKGTWRVTEFAAKKFGFFEQRLNEDEAPSRLATEPQESLAQGDQTGAD